MLVLIFFTSCCYTNGMIITVYSNSLMKVCVCVYVCGTTSLGNGYKHMKYEIRDGVAVIRLDSPGAKVYK